jgi:large subunit ribosomal protein L9
VGDFVFFNYFFYGTLIHMKVILQKDVPKIGQRLAIKEVPDGYAVNFLIPKGLAIAATAENLAKRDKEVSSREDAKALESKLVEAHFNKAADEALVISAPANEQGHLFKAVTTKMIVNLLSEKRNISIPESALVLEHPIKAVGPYEIPLVYKNQKKTLHVLIEKDK